MAELTARLNLTVPMVVRKSFTLPNPQLAGLGPIFDVSITKFMSLTGGYLFVTLPKTGPGYNVHVPLAAITLRHNARRIHLSDRNRAEKLIGLLHSPVRYRNKLAVELPLPARRYAPFVTDEVFYDFSQSAWTQNRLEAGVAFRLNRLLQLDTYYLERSAHKTRPSSIHSLGLTLEIRIKSLQRNSP
jgi:hypothetical protein